MKRKTVELEGVVSELQRAQREAADAHAEAETARKNLQRLKVYNQHNKVCMATNLHVRHSLKKSNFGFR